MQTSQTELIRAIASFWVPSIRDYNYHSIYSKLYNVSHQSVYYMAPHTPTNRVISTPQCHIIAIHYFL